jgi:hypothetical protein
VCWQQKELLVSIRPCLWSPETGQLCVEPGEPRYSAVLPGEIQLIRLSDALVVTQLNALPDVERRCGGSSRLSARALC